MTAYQSFSFRRFRGRAEGLVDSIPLRPLELYCFDLTDPTEVAICQDNLNANLWYKSGGRRVDVRAAVNCVGQNPDFEAECKAMMIKDVAIQRKDCVGL